MTYDTECIHTACYTIRTIYERSFRVYIKRALLSFTRFVWSSWTLAYISWHSK